MRRSVLLIGGAALGLVVAAALVACGSEGEPKARPTAAATSTPEAGPTKTPPSPGFSCPTQWHKYACPSTSAGAGVLTLPYPAGAEAEIVCQNVEFYTSGVVNNVSMLYKLAPNTEVVALADGQVTGVRSSPAPHEYTKSITLDAKQFLIQIYFVGEPRVSANATVARGDVLGVITGTFPTDSLPDSKLNGASMIINIMGLDPRMLDASDPELWAGGVPSCYAP
jgi:hypothetical protein